MAICGLKATNMPNCRKSTGKKEDYDEDRSTGGTGGIYRT